MPSRLSLVAVVALSVLTACGNAGEPNAQGPGGPAVSAGTASVSAGGAMAAAGNGSSSGGTLPTAGAFTTGGATLIGGDAANSGSAPAGSGTSSGGLPAGGTASGGQAGTASNGSTGGGLSGGAAGTAGGSGGNSSTGSVGGAMATGGTDMGGGGGSTDRGWSCPEGPFPTPMVLSSEDVCEDFAFNHTWNEGPTWVASQGAFFFTNFVVRSASGGDIIKYTPGVGCEIFLPDVGCNGLAVSNDGNLLAACQQTRSVLRIDLETKEISPVADSYMDMMLDTPNDLVQHTNGTIYFTNPTNELAGRPVGVGPATFRIDPNGAVSMIAEGNCNGIALSPDESKLYVLLSGMWDLDEQGVPSNGQEMFTRGDGMAVDCAGNVYANGSIFDPDGQSIGSWGSGTNLAFGGEDGQTMLVVASGAQVRELTMNIPGLP